MDIGTLTGRLVLDDTFSSGLDGALGKLQSAGEKVGQQFKNAGSALTVGLTLPIVGLGAGAIKLASDFESSFAGVRKTVNASEPELQKLSQAFRNMSKEIPTTVNELNKIAEAGGQLGVKTADLEGFTRTMAAMGEATNLSSDEAATSLAQIANIINDQAGPQYDRLASTIVALGNAGASTEKDITEFGLRLAGAGKVAGLTQAEILSIGSALASVGINAEAGGTSFSKVFMMLTESVSEGEGAVKKFSDVAGVSAASFAKTFKEEPAEAITLFVEGLGKINKEGGNLFGTLENLGVTESRMKDALLRSAGAGDLLRKSIQDGNKAWQENTALTKEAEQRYKTTESQMKTLWNKITDVGITLGQTLIPAMLSAVNAAEPLLKIVEKMAGWFADLPKPLQTTTIAILGVAAVVGPLFMVFGSMMTGVSALIPVYAGLSAALVFLGNTVPVLTARLWLMEVAQKAAAAATWLANTALGALFLTIGAGAIVVGALTAVVVAGYQAFMLYKEGQDRLAAAQRQGVVDGDNLIRLNTAMGTSYKTVDSASAEYIRRKKEEVVVVADVVAETKKVPPVVHAATDAQKEHAKAVAAANEKIREAYRDVGQLTEKQKAAVVAHDKLNISTNDTALSLGVSVAAVTKYKEGLAQLVKNTDELTKASEKIKPIAGLWENFFGVINKLGPAAQAIVDKAFGTETTAQVRALDDAFKHISANGLLTGDRLKYIATEAGKMSKEGATLTSELYMLAIAQGKLAAQDVTKGLPPGFLSGIGREIDPLVPKVQKTADVVATLADGFVALSQVGGNMGPLLQSLGAIFNQLKTGEKVYEDYRKTVVTAHGDAAGAAVKNFGIATPLFDANASTADKWASGIATGMAVTAGAMSVWSATANDTTKAAGAFHGAMAGAEAGAAFGPWGVAIGAAGGALLGLIHTLSAGRRAVVDFANSFDTLAPGTGFDELHVRLGTLGASGEQMWIQLTQGTPKGNAEAAKEQIAKIQIALAALDADLQRYKLSWDNMVDAQIGGTKAGDALVESFKRLTGAGYTSDAIIKAMGSDLNAYIAASLAAGTKIPADMQKIIEKLILSGQLTDANAKAMLGLSAAAMPSLADIKSAAERYGITLDSLGTKVKQLQITELADQYVKDWKILTAATDDWGVLFDKMGPKVQSLVTDAINYGSALPAGMKPMIQAFIDAGKLTDENGVKLTDLSKLTFAADLSAMFETLITKLDELIDKIAVGVGGAFDTLGNKIVRPTIKPRYDGSDLPTSADGTEPDTPPGFAAGGIVPNYYGSGSNVIAFTPRGTDTVPAMLTPGERVLSVQQNKDYERGGDDSAIRNELIMMRQDLQRLMRDQPRAIAVAIQDSAVLATRRTV